MVGQDFEVFSAIFFTYIYTFQNVVWIFERDFNLLFKGKNRAKLTCTLNVKSHVWFKVMAERVSNYFSTSKAELKSILLSALQACTASFW